VAYWGDRDRARQILVNLLSNAVKFTPAGGQVRVGCRVTTELPREANLEGRGPWLGIDVEDTGIGVPSEQQVSIFDPFVQVDPSHTRERGGTGLGLTISRRLARLMKGDLTLRSEQGVGSCFTLWLPSADAGAVEGRERRVLPRGPHQVPRLSEVGHALIRHAEAIVEELTRQLRAEPLQPEVAKLKQPQLDDHVLTFLVDIGLAIVALDTAGGQPSIVRDGTEIQRTISELHGAQRARLGFTEQALRREFEILGEVTLGTLRQAFPDDPTVEDALDTLQYMLEQAERISLRGWNRASEKRS
jgi:hypothetical protein